MSQISESLIKCEYRVRTRTVYFITRYCVVGDKEAIGSACTEEGDFRDEVAARRAAKAFAEFERKRWEVGEDDQRVRVIDERPPSETALPIVA